MEPAPNASDGARQVTTRQDASEGCAAYILAPFAAGITGVLTLAAQALVSDANGDPLGIVSAFLVGTMFGYVGLIFLGTPVHLFLRWQRLTSSPSYAVSFLILSAFLTVPLMAYAGKWPNLSDWIYIAGITAATCATGIFFWGIARPDKHPRRRK